jgi:hypothetical protein
VIPRYRLLQERISHEWAEARRAAEKSQQAFEASRLETNPTFTLDSVALNLHGFYNGVERAFEAIGRELDGSVPSGQHWHRDLLEQMAYNLRDVRPAVIRLETRDALEPYLRFRHLIRNLYTWDLDPNLLAQRLAALQPTLDALDMDLETFKQFLETALTADESGA